MWVEKEVLLLEFKEGNRGPKYNEINVFDVAYNAILKGKYDMDCICSVWEQICKFIETNLYMKRAVSIRDFGTFTFFEHAAPNTFAESMWTYRPLFLMDKGICQSYDLKCNRQPPPTKLVTVYPNYFAIGSLVPCSRFNVEEILSRIVLAVRKLCMHRQEFKLEFPRLGTLYIKNRTVDMRFNLKFTKKLHKVVIDPSAFARLRPKELEEKDEPKTKICYRLKN